MKFNPCSLAILLGVGLSSVSASAAWLDMDNNLRNGLQFGIRGTIYPSIVESHSTFNYLLDDPRIFDRKSNGRVTRVGTMADVLAYKDRQMTDERARVNGMESGDIYIDATKMLTRDLSLGGYVRLYGSTSGDRKAFYFYGLNFSHDKYGAIAVRSGNYNFRTANVAMSGQYNPLETQASAISARFTYIPNLTLAGFYAFPAANDVNSLTNTSLHSGYGLSANYNWSLGALHNIGVGVGHTNNERHLKMSSSRYGDELPVDKEATAVGISYRYDGWKLSADVGRTTEELNGALISKVKTKNAGAKLEYEFTPRATAYVAYGKQTSDKTAPDGKSLDFDALIDNSRTVTESLVFDKVKKERLEVGGSYAIHHNISLIGSVSNEETTNYVEEGKFSERQNRVYSAGMRFAF